MGPDMSCITLGKVRNLIAFFNGPVAATVLAAAPAAPAPVPALPDEAPATALIALAAILALNAAALDADWFTVMGGESAQNGEGGCIIS